LRQAPGGAGNKRENRAGAKAIFSFFSGFISKHGQMPWRKKKGACSALAMLFILYSP
jgi:hypothetical protein